MWLVNTNTHRLEFFVGHHVPKYAILSHTWGKEAEEVSFQEWKESTAISKREKRFDKIMSACSRARDDGIEYLWVDTNCIDKSSSAELSEAINSMYSWYAKARVCYVYLVDVEDPDNVAETFLDEGESVDNDVPEESRHNCTVTVAAATDRAMARARFKEAFCSSRWFLRGWTLQELVAPTDIRFFTNDWKPIGRTQIQKMSRTRTRREEYEKLLHQISMITGIDFRVLLKTRTLSSCSVGERMSWSASRDTTREEDMAYCMMGIFDINMPLLYGEGKKAFQRLQEEIVRRTSDHSLFAWQYSMDASARMEWKHRFLPNLFAISPKRFSNFGNLTKQSTLRFHEYQSPLDSVISLTNVGMSLNLELIHTTNPNFFLGALNLEVMETRGIALPNQSVWCIGLIRIGQFYYRTEFPPAPILIGSRRVNPPQQIHIPPRRPAFGLYSLCGMDYAFLIAFPEVSMASGYYIASHEVSGHMICHPGFSAFSVQRGHLSEKDASYAIVTIGSKEDMRKSRELEEGAQVYIGIRKTNGGIEIDAQLYERHEDMESIRQRKGNFRNSFRMRDHSRSWTLVVERGPTTHDIPTTRTSPTSSASDPDLYSDSDVGFDSMPETDAVPRSGSPLLGSEKHLTLFSVCLYKKKGLIG